MPDNQPMPTYMAPATPANPPSSDIQLTEMDKQIIQIKKDIAETRQAILISKKETLSEVKEQIDNNLAQQKTIIETTMKNLMNLFFDKQEEAQKKEKLEQLKKNTGNR